MTKKTDGALHWMRFNPTEWVGKCDGLPDAAFGLYHRVLAKLWATPGNAMPLGDLKALLFIADGSDRDQCLTLMRGAKLIAVDEDGIATIPGLHKEFLQAIGRKKQATDAANTRWDVNQPLSTGNGP